jgi:formylglycine-generating enzyme required for sulfatase activity
MQRLLCGLARTLRGACACSVALLFTPPVQSGDWVTIPAGEFLVGSGIAQVQLGYKISAAGYGHERIRQFGWFDHEIPQHRLNLPAFRIQKTPVTQSEYARFVAETGYKPPLSMREPGNRMDWRIPISVRAVTTGRITALLRTN